jgi:hypothetical protein
MEPSAGGYAKFDLPYPAVFWACEASGFAEDMHSNEVPDNGNYKELSNAWSIASTVYDALFPANTTFWHLQPVPGNGSSLYNTVVVPVADSDMTHWVGVGTALAVALGTSWVLWALLAAWFTSAPRHDKAIMEHSSRQEEDVVVAGVEGGDDITILAGSNDSSLIRRRNAAISK